MRLTEEAYGKRLFALDQNVTEKYQIHIQPTDPLFSCHIHMGKTALYFAEKGHVTEILERK